MPTPLMSSEAREQRIERLQQDLRRLDTIAAKPGAQSDPDVMADLDAARNEIRSELRALGSRLS